MADENKADNHLANNHYGNQNAQITRSSVMNGEDCEYLLSAKNPDISELAKVNEEFNESEEVENEINSVKVPLEKHQYLRTKKTANSYSTNHKSLAPNPTDLKTAIQSSIDLDTRLQVNSTKMLNKAHRIANHYKKNNDTLNAHRIIRGVENALSGALDLSDPEFYTNVGFSQDYGSYNLTLGDFIITKFRT